MAKLSAHGKEVVRYCIMTENGQGEPPARRTRVVMEDGAILEKFDSGRPNGYHSGWKRSRSWIIHNTPEQLAKLLKIWENAGWQKVAND